MPTKRDYSKPFAFTGLNEGLPDITYQSPKEFRVNSMITIRDREKMTTQAFQVKECRHLGKMEYEYLLRPLGPPKHNTYYSTPENPQGPKRKKYYV